MRDRGRTRGEKEVENECIATTSIVGETCSVCVCVYTSQLGYGVKHSSYSGP